MKVFLLHLERDADLERPLPPNAEALAQDLELGMLFDAMAGGDEYLRSLVEQVLFTSLGESDAIRYRQGVLTGSLERPAVVRELYALAVEALDAKQKARHFWFQDSPEMLLQKSLTMLGLLVDVLERLRKVADEHATSFASDGFTRLFATLSEELGDDYLRTVQDHLRELEFRRGTLISAELGRGNRGRSYVLRKPACSSRLSRSGPMSAPASSHTSSAKKTRAWSAANSTRSCGG